MRYQTHKRQAIRSQTQGLIEQTNGTLWKLDKNVSNWAAGLPHMMVSINQRLYSASRQVPFESRFFKAVQAQNGVAAGGEALLE